MKIAYIGHSYHAQTGSNAFFFDLLRDVALVDVYWDEGWLGRENVDLGEILARDYDVIILYQVERHAKPLNDSRARVIFVPMHDSCLPFVDDFWKELTRIEILCFCRALYERLAGWGLHAKYVQFFPDAERFEANAASEHAGFFWSRCPEPSWQTVKALLGEPSLSWINIHLATDPMVGAPPAISAEDQARYRLRFTEWSEDKTSYTRVLQQVGIYFAPRLQEGIGMAFLEAMAMGKAVVAADNPTMNEYITHQVNGYLFDPGDPKPIDLSRFREIGQAARQSMERGHLRWKLSKRALLEWIATGVWPEQQSTRLAHSRSGPTISVIIPPTLDNDAVEQTRLSVEAQEHCPVEHIVASLPATAKSKQATTRLGAAARARQADTLNAVAAAARGEWLIFLDAGTVLIDQNALKEALENTSTDADFIICHYLERRGTQESMHRVAEFDDAVERFTSGRLDPLWFAKLPILSATLINRRVFERAGFSRQFHLAADIDFFLRCKEKGAIFHHGNTTLSRIRTRDVNRVLERTKECRKVFLGVTSNRESVNTLCDSLSRAECDPLLDAWTRLGTLNLCFNLMRHPEVARYATFRAWRHLRFLGIRGILLRQLLWLKHRIRPSGGSPIH